MGRIGQFRGSMRGDEEQGREKWSREARCVSVFGISFPPPTGSSWQRRELQVGLTTRTTQIALLASC